MTIIASLLRAAELPDSPTARLDAELLLAAALGKSRSNFTREAAVSPSGAMASRSMSLATSLALSSGSSSLARFTLMNSLQDMMDSARKNIISGALSRSSLTAWARRRRGA